MAIKIIDGPDTIVTASELQKYQSEYVKAYLMYSGIPPTLEEFIIMKRKEMPGLLTE